QQMSSRNRSGTMWYGCGWYVSGEQRSEEGAGPELCWHAASGAGFAAYFLRKLRRDNGELMTVIGLGNLEELDVGMMIEGFYKKYYSPYWQWIKQQGKPNKSIT